VRDAPKTSPLPAVLAFTAISNFATGVATVGVFFLAQSAYGFTTEENYRLGLLLGVTYALAAWRAGPIVRAIARPGGRSSRMALAWMALAMAALCALPYLAAERGPEGRIAGGRWAIYLFVALYTPITGVYWPLVESFLSGGRRGEGMRRAIGAFNVTWSASMSLAMWIVAPLVETRPLEILLFLAPVHVASLALLVPFGRDPGRHEEEAHAVPASYRALLGGHRILLVAGYVVMFGLTPYLPELLQRLRVDETWSAALGSVWMAARVGVFWLFGRWQGWHGRRAVGAIGAALLALGFALAVGSPYLGAGVGLAVLIAGQVLFGVALAALYTANLYYTLEVGQAAVDAGGSHEGLIGLGYSIGPLLGWTAHGLASAGALPAGRSNELVLATIEVLTLTAAWWAWRVTRPRAL